VKFENVMLKMMLCLSFVVRIRHLVHQCAFLPMVILTDLLLTFVTVVSLWTLSPSMKLYSVCPSQYLEAVSDRCQYVTGRVRTILTLG